MFGFGKMFFQGEIPLERDEIPKQELKMKQTFKIEWRGIPISIFYQPDSSQAHKEIMGEFFGHIEVKANEPLPISSTGYRSLFLPFYDVGEQGGAILLVKTWLEKSSQSAEWKEYMKEKRQLKLF